MLDAELHRPERRIPPWIDGASQPFVSDEAWFRGFLRGLPFWVEGRRLWAEARMRS